MLLAGRLTRWKGQGLLIEAMTRLKARGENRILLLLVGDDQGRKGYRAELEAAIAAAGLEDSGQAGRPLRRHARRLSAGGPGHRPSLEPEAFGRTAVEPQVMGRPVLASTMARRARRSWPARPAGWSSRATPRPGPTPCCRPAEVGAARRQASGPGRPDTRAAVVFGGRDVRSDA
ncbi:glycosyltransferase [Caulobacter segnis]